MTRLVVCQTYLNFNKTSISLSLYYLAGCEIEERIIERFRIPNVTRERWYLNKFYLNTFTVQLLLRLIHWTNYRIFEHAVMTWNVHFTPINDLHLSTEYLNKRTILTWGCRLWIIFDTIFRFSKEVYMQIQQNKWRYSNNLWIWTATTITYSFLSHIMLLLL